VDRWHTRARWGGLSNPGTLTAVTNLAATVVAALRTFERGKESWPLRVAAFARPPRVDSRDHFRRRPTSFQPATQQESYRRISFDRFVVLGKFGVIAYRVLTMVCYREFDPADPTASGGGGGGSPASRDDTKLLALVKKASDALIGQILDEIAGRETGKTALLRVAARLGDRTTPPCGDRHGSSH
jgi:hypothetical protein